MYVFISLSIALRSGRIQIEDLFNLNTSEA